MGSVTKEIMLSCNPTVFGPCSPHSREEGFPGKDDVSVCLAFCSSSGFYPPPSPNHSKFVQASYFQQYHSTNTGIFNHTSMSWNLVVSGLFINHIHLSCDISGAGRFACWNQRWSGYLRANWSISCCWMILFLGLAERAEEFSFCFSTVTFNSLFLSLPLSGSQADLIV